MKPTILLRSTLFVTICLLASKLPSNAQVVNGSFEDTTSPFFANGHNPYSDQYPGYNDFPTTEMFTGWEVQSHKGGIRYSEISTAGYTGADGSYAVEALDGGYLESLDPVVTIVANQIYTLTLALNDPTGAGASSFQLLATSQQYDSNTGYTWNPGPGYTSIMSPNPLITTLGTLVDSGTISGGSTTATNFATYTIKFDTFGTDNSAYVGDNLSILVNLGAGASVDNIVETPEPSTWALMLAGAASLLVIGRRKLQA